MPCSASCLLVLACLRCAAIDVGDLPQHLLPPAGFPDYAWRDPGGWQEVDLAAAGLRPDDPGTDAGVALMRVVATGSGRRILRFAAGTYSFRQTCRLSTGGLQLVGAGPKTVLRIDLPVDATEQDGIVVHGAPGGDTGLRLARPWRRGTASMVIAGGTVAVGDLLRIEAPRPLQPAVAAQLRERLFAAAQDHERIAAALGHPDTLAAVPERVYPTGQLVTVQAIASDGTVTVDLPAGLDLPQGATVVRMRPAEDVRVANLTIERVRATSARAHNLSLIAVRNLELTGITGRQAAMAHIAVGFGRDIRISGCDLRGGLGYERSGGYGYGIWLYAGTTWATVVDNTTADLRHGLIVNAGVNHAVLADHRSLPPYRHYGDINIHNGGQMCHHILVENCAGAEITVDDQGLVSVSGKSGMYSGWNLVFLRNRASAIVGSQSPMPEGVLLVGNEAPEGGLGLLGQGVVAGGNRIGGVLRWDGLAEGSRWPASLFRRVLP
jgi:hypothetical protein